MVKVLRNTGDSPCVQTNWISPAGAESAKSKSGKEMAVISPKNTTQMTCREFEK
jgi:hypothetical protein